VYILATVLGGLILGLVYGLRSDDQLRARTVRLRLRWWRVGLGVLLLTAWLGGSPSQPSLVRLAGLLILLVILASNRRQPFASLVLTGAVLNLVTILANGGLMPITVRTAALPRFYDVIGQTQLPLRPVALWPLSDILVDPWSGWVFSLGDLLVLAGGVAWLIGSWRSRRAGSEELQPQTVEASLV
jgi:hypothetical protein